MTMGPLGFAGGPIRSPLAGCASRPNGWRAATASRIALLLIAPRGPAYRSSNGRPRSPSAAAFLADAVLCADRHGEGGSSMDRSGRHPACARSATSPRAAGGRAGSLLGLRSAASDVYSRRDPPGWGNRSQRIHGSRFHRMSAEFDYDPATDSLYIKLRPGESVDNRILGDDVVIDLGADGEPVGYDIQHASQHAEAIAEALADLRRRFASETHPQSGGGAG